MDNSFQTERVAPYDFVPAALSLNNKLMGQANLVRLGLPFISDGGSFTLTSGLLSREPIPGSAAISLVNAGLEGLVRAAALELSRGVRINVVSPPWVTGDVYYLIPSGRQPAYKVGWYGRP